MTGRTAATLAGRLAAIAPHLPDALLPRPAYQAARTAAGLLPEAASRFFGLECGLGAGAERLGFLACVSRGEGAALARTPIPPALDDAGARTWAALRRFAAEWDRPGSPHHRSVLNLWLEFDLEGAAVCRTPSAFLGARGVLGADQKPAAHLLAGRLEELTRSRLAPGTRACLARCLAPLPAGAGIFQAGLMSSRTPSALRICVTGLRHQDIVPYARAAGWPGDSARAGRLVAGAGAATDRIDVDLDLTEEVGPTLGLELSFVPKRRPGREPRWARLVDELVRTGLSTRPAGDALLGFAGHDRIEPSPAAGPGGRIEVLARGLNHLKLTLRPDGGCSAKAYLSVRHLSWPADRVTG
ncbi:hypothetical protein [Streptomyces jumonjinensis]|uniref:Uncharacterized protein n=1 Tax=Streptomyces jumonjinensis TaxID=1945 RepID=A0A646KIQ7_STRJU|nr:hypothetical protein [Streptomyces jumonjinensis]MQT02145.1 hypothetical protein [Streptomyces jumonjinensis]